MQDVVVPSTTVQQEIKVKKKLSCSLCYIKHLTPCKSLKPIVGDGWLDEERKMGECSIVELQT